MPQVLWPLLHHRPIVEVVLSPMAGSPSLVRQLIADTGAGTARAGFELLLPENDCLLCGGIPSYPVTLGGAYAGTFPVYAVRVEIPALSFNRHLRAVGVPMRSRGFDGIAGFRLLNRFTYGNFGDPSRFGVET
jgi:hypothetical protein